MTPEKLVHSDPVGFPMIWVGEIHAYMHWLPVTKIQFEYFLCSAPDLYFDASWYEEILRLNPRLSARNLTSRSYWRALLTGIEPGEAQRYAAWCGDGYRLPSAEEWVVAYQALRRRPVSSLAGLGILKERPARICELINAIEESTEAALQRMSQSRDYADQMLLRLGVLEWVRLDGRTGGWGLKGEPFPEFCGNLEIGEAEGPLSPSPTAGGRFPCAGFRLLYFPHEERDSVEYESVAQLNPDSDFQS